MNIFTIDGIQTEALCCHMREKGLVVIPNVVLPDTFTPSHTDLVILQIADALEVYIQANVCYHGTSPLWQQIMARPEQRGKSRLVARVEGSAETALRLIKCYLLDSGGHIASENEQQVHTDLRNVLPQIGLSPHLMEHFCTREVHALRTFLRGYKRVLLRSFHPDASGIPDSVAADFNAAFDALLDAPEEQLRELMEMPTEDTLKKT